MHNPKKLNSQDSQHVSRSAYGATLKDEIDQV
jgi:hypothetical protein